MGLFKPNIDKLKAKRDVAGLIKALQHEDSWIRSDAVEALGEIGNKRVVEPLIKALGDESERVRRKAAEALGEIGDSTAVKPLIIAIQNCRDTVLDPVYRSAVKALSKIGTPAVEPLIKALGDREYKLYNGAAEALSKIGDPAVLPLLDSDEKVRKRAIAVCNKIGDLVGHLIKALQEGDRFTRRKAVDKLRIFGDTRAVDPLIKALRDSDEYVRKSAAFTLGRIGDEGAIEPLIKALESGNEGATKALKEMGSEYPEKMESSISKLMNLLDGKDRQISSSAAEVIEIIGEEKPEFLREFWQVRKLVTESHSGELIKLYCAGVDIVPQIIRLFHGFDERIRPSAAYIFGKVGEKYPEEVKEGIFKLVPLLDDENSYVQEDAFKSLVKIGMKRPDIVIEAIPGMVKYRGFPDIAKGLKGFASGESDNAKEPISGLISLLYAEEDEVRDIAAFALGVIGEEHHELVKNAIPPLMKLLNEKESKIVCFAFGSIGKNRPEWIRNAIPKLIKMLEKARDKERYSKVVTIADALGKIGKNRPEMVKDAIPELVLLLQYRDIEVCVSAAEALLKIGELGEESGEVVSNTIKFLSKKDVYAREKASLLLGALKEHPKVKEALPLLGMLLDDACWRVRGAAAFAIGEIGEVVSVEISSSLSDTIPLLIRLLDDEKAWVRLSAAYALGEIGGVEALEELKKLENDKEGCKIVYLGEEREFVVREIVRVAEEKIEARIEGREIKPELIVSLSKTKLKKEVQNVELFVENNGKVSAKDIEIGFPDVVRVEGLRKFSLRAGEGRKLELEVEPREAGRISLALTISFKDFKGNEYRCTEKFRIEVEEAIIPTKREIMEKKEVILERAIYDPCKRDFIEKILPRMKDWIDRHDSRAYWFAVSIQNNTDELITEWDVDLTMSSALKVIDAKIEDREREIPHEAHLKSFKISVPKAYGITIPEGGSQRVYFKLRADKPKTTYEISGVFKSAITGDVPIRTKEFKYLCDTGVSPEAVKAELKKTFSEKDAARLALSFKTVQELDRMCNQEAKTEEYQDKLLVLGNYTEGLRENFTKQVNEFARFMKEEQLEYLDDAYKEKVRRFCTNLVDVWISEFLKG